MKSVLFKQNLAFVALSLFVGLGAGAVCGVFGAVLDQIVPYARANFSVNVWFMPLAGLFTAAIFRLFGDGRQGMGAVFAAANGKGRGVGLRTVAFQFAGTWSAHLLCASVGREGAAVQIGAAIGGSVGKSVPVAGADRVLLVAGMAAGFSALFGTPACAVCFALEVTVVGGMRLRALTASAFASFAAYFAASLCGGAVFSPQVACTLSLTVSTVLRVFALGAACGIAGLLFCLARKYASLFFSAALPDPVLRALLAGALLSCLLFLTGGRYAGLGTNLVQAALNGDAVFFYDWIVKILFTAVTLSVGFLGGEVTTFFAAGACLGSVLGTVLGLPPAVCACIGYAAVFGAATNTLFAPVFLCAEVFGGEYLPFAAVACIAAYLFNFGHSVYDQRVREGVAGRLFRLRRRAGTPLPRRLY